MKDYSYGLVPIYMKNEQVPLFLLIKQQAGHWSFPKGHKEEGETDIEAAKREMLEETGIAAVKVIEDIQFLEKYSWDDNGTFIDKTVTFYPCFCEGQELDIAGDEVIDAGWFTYDEARKQITYKESLAVLDAARAWLMTAGERTYENIKSSVKKELCVTTKALFRRGQQIFMLQDRSGNWELPGGKMEYGESVHDTLKREVKEEINVADLKIGKIVDLFDFTVPYTHAESHFVALIFDCQSSLAKIKISHEHISFGFFSLDEIKKLPMREEYRKILSDFLTSRLTD